MENKTKKRKFSIYQILFVVGIIISSFSIVIYISGKSFFKSQLRVNLALKKDSETLKQWANPISTVYRKYYFFNVTNSWRYLKGADKKPILVERGPYVYREDKKAVNIKYTDENTMSYDPETKLYFEPNLSVGNESDIITFLNIPATAMIDKAVKENPSTDEGTINFGILAMNGVLEYLNVKLFLTGTVGDLIKGYEDPLLTLGKVALPQLITSNKFSLLNGENDTIKENFTIMTGVDDIKNLGKVVKWNGLKELHAWETPEANIVKGMDPSVFQPFVTPNYVPVIYTSSLGKPVKLEFSKETKIDGFDTLEFFLRRDTFYNSSLNPENIGYCSKCLGNGVHFIGPLSSGSPTYISQPHFLNAEEKFVNSVEGLKPDYEKHDFHFNYEPNSGIPIKGIGRMQINLLLQGNKHLSLTKNIETILFPVFWVEVTFKHHPSTLKLLGDVQLFSKLITIIPFVFFSIGLIICLCSITVLMYDRLNSVNMSENSEKLNKIYKGKEYMGVNIKPEKAERSNTV